ncbi:Cyclopropane mycolic acid synthase MmaA2 [Mycobacterium marinum]|nr:Cyclopropane mycolic acid synthase MmaA2 [Mycobacterium marinum]EPQ74762.1 Cyclopropane-fatty-acyl-phospholipid synthase [Mycobacterium marinum str. Europe]CDM77862.1 hypothetical protein MMARE11_37250 [Mycobacterium marinum E11]RFZ09002.1 Cyclopropane mycolic acid synthase MmaA2 [Mycobacterium marinum]RFZ32863.1 Cyclopropane mycolic acid synthase MmaA2 [Mycobacterium marinum]
MDFEWTRQGDAIQIQSDGGQERFVRCLTGCSKPFREGYIDVNQFTLQKAR